MATRPCSSVDSGLDGRDSVSGVIRSETARSAENSDIRVRYTYALSTSIYMQLGIGWIRSGLRLCPITGQIQKSRTHGVSHVTEGPDPLSTHTYASSGPGRPCPCHFPSARPRYPTTPIVAECLQAMIVQSVI